MKGKIYLFRLYPGNKELFEKKLHEIKFTDQLFQKEGFYVENGE